MIEKEKLQPGNLIKVDFPSETPRLKKTNDGYGVVDAYKEEYGFSLRMITGSSKGKKLYFAFPEIDIYPHETFTVADDA
jgi:hypothetical protein